MNANSSIFITLHNTQLQMYQTLKHKPRQTKPGVNEVENSLECIGKGEDFLSRTLIVKALRKQNQ